MSGECSFFRFCLRGDDSLASKWISQKRKVGKLREDGANIYSISDYIHHVFCFEKLYGTEYTSNVLFNKIITANHLDKNHIVKFDEEILIPFSFSSRTYKNASLDELAKEIENESLADVKLGDLFSENEIKEMLVNTYHINYDIRSDENIAGKTYDEIIREGFLEFKDGEELYFFLPYIFEVSTKKVVESSEVPVGVSLAASSIQPEINESCPNCNQNITGAQLKKIFSEASDGRCNEIATAFNKYYKSFGLNTCLRRAHFFAQAREEAGIKLTATEGLNYSVAGLKATFITYCTANPDFADKYGRKEDSQDEAGNIIKGHPADQEGIANHVYAGVNGNGDVKSGDGWKYRGGGLIQVTGKYNYNAIMKTIRKKYPTYTDIDGNNAR